MKIRGKTCGKVCGKVCGEPFGEPCGKAPREVPGGHTAHRSSALIVAALLLPLSTASAAPKSPPPSSPSPGAGSGGGGGAADGCGDAHDFFFSSSRTKRGYLGIQLLRLTDELVAHFGAPKDAVLLVSKVEKDSPASAAGIRVGDILVEVDGRRVGSVWDVASLVQPKKEGDRVAVRVARGGRTVTLRVAIKLRERPRIDVGGFIRGGPGDEDLEIDWGPRLGAFDQAMERWRKHLEGLSGTKILRFYEREGDLEKQLREMEERLRQLEKKLRAPGRQAPKGNRTAM